VHFSAGSRPCMRYAAVLWLVGTRNGTGESSASGRSGWSRWVVVVSCILSCPACGVRPDFLLDGSDTESALFPPFMAVLLLGNRVAFARQLFRVEDPCGSGWRRIGAARGGCIRCQRVSFVAVSRSASGTTDVHMRGKGPSRSAVDLFRLPRPVLSSSPYSSSSITTSSPRPPAHPPPASPSAPLSAYIPSGYPPSLNRRRESEIDAPGQLPGLDKVRKQPHLMVLVTDSSRSIAKSEYLASTVRHRRWRSNEPQTCSLSRIANKKVAHSPSHLPPVSIPPPFFFFNYLLPSAPSSLLFSSKLKRKSSAVVELTLTMNLILPLRIVQT